MANYNSDYTGAQIDSAISRANSTDVTAGTIAASKAVVVDSNKDITGFRHITATGTVTAANVSLTGNVDLGDASGDTVTITGSIDSNLIPATDDTYDIGSATYAWQDLFLEGDITFSDAGTLSTTAGDLTINAGSGEVVFGNENLTTTGTIDSGSQAVTGNVVASGTVSAEQLTSSDDLTVSGLATIGETLAVTGVVTAAGFTIGSAVINEAELETIDGITAGTVIASKAIVTDSNIDITGGRNITISGELDAATLDISGNADIDGTLEADAYTVDGTTLAEYIADTAGAMVSSNTESGITVTYQDGDNTVDLSVDAAQTGITSIYATDLILGEDSQTAIDFGTANEIDFKADNAARLTLTASALYPVTDNQIDLGTSSLEFKDAFFDGTVTSDAFTDGTLSVASGSISSAVNGTFSGTVQAEQLTTTDDLTVSGLATIGETLAVTGVVTSAGFTIGSAAIVEAELETIDGVTAGTVAASKAVVVDSNKDIGTFRNVTIDGTFSDGNYTFDTSGNVSGLGTIGSGAITSSGVITGTTIEATGDTSSGDNAAIGYTSAEGLILTGQGSTSDVTLKNDADGTVFTVPTGTDDILFPDSAKGMWGAASDMQLYHDGTNSYITNATGALKIATESSGIAITLGHGTSEVTVADNLTVTGDLTVSGTTTTVSSGTLTIGDTLIKLGQAYTGSAYDQGIVFTRGDGSSTNTQNMAFIWDESADTFATIKAATEAGTTSGNVTVTDHVPLRVGALTADDASTFTSTISAATGSTIGNLTLANGSITDSSGAISFGDENLSTSGTLGAGVITATGFTIGSAVITEAELEILDGASLSTTELNYVDGVTSAIQTQIDTKAPLASPTFTGTITIGSAGISETELEILDGLTVTTDELNIMDGSATTQATVTLAGTDGVVISDGDVMKQALVSDFEVYMEANLDTMGSQFTSASSLATVGTIGTGVWQGTAIASAYLDADTAHLSTTQTFSGAKTFSDGVVITTADNSDTLSLISTDADANAGPNLRLYRNSGSPAGNDLLGNIQWEGRNNNSQDVIYSEMRAQIETTTDGSEDANFKWSMMKAGASVDRLSINANATVFNDESVDVDFRVESDNLTHALFVQGSDGKVGINKTPSDWHLDVDSPNQYIMSLDGSNNTGLTINSDSGQADIIGYSNSASSYNKINIRGASGTGLVVSGLNVGIGTSAPDKPLHVWDGNAGSHTVNGGTNVLIEGDSSTYLEFATPADQSQGILFADPAGVTGQITYSHGTDDMTITADDNILLTCEKVGIGTTAPDNLTHIYAGDASQTSNTSFTQLTVEHSGHSGINILSGVNSYGTIYFGDSGSSSAGIVQYGHGTQGDNLSLGTAGAIAMTIDGSGDVGIGTTAPTDTRVLHVKSTVAGTTTKIENAHGSTPYGPEWVFSAADPDNNSQYFLHCEGNGTTRLIIYSDGDVQNNDNAYGSTSDSRIKQGIRDSNSQWDDIKAMKVRNFKRNADVAKYGENAWEQIGVISQELEASGMDKLVREHPAQLDEITHSEDISEGDMVKSVQYSIIYMKAIKALQEAMSKIETLETKVTALENA